MTYSAPAWDWLPFQAHQILDSLLGVSIPLEDTPKAPHPSTFLPPNSILPLIRDPYSAGERKEQQLYLLLVIISLQDPSRDWGSVVYPVYPSGGDRARGCVSLGGTFFLLGLPPHYSVRMNRTSFTHMNLFHMVVLYNPSERQVTGFKTIFKRRNEICLRCSIQSKALSNFFLFATLQFW